MKTELIEKAYAIARERYAGIGVDTEKALAALQNISLSLHCWQADDVTGFENRGGDLTGGIQATATTRQSPQHRRAACRHPQGQVVHSRYAPPEPA